MRPLAFPRVFFVLVGAACFAACVVEEPDLSRYTGSGIQNLEEARDVVMTYTDSTALVFKMKAPVSRRIINKFSASDEFPEGVEVTFYGKTERPVSWLTADYAIRNPSERFVRAEKNVVLRNVAGERLDAPELIWDESARQIRTDRFVRITRADGSVIYSYGLVSNETFTRYELNAVAGDIALPPSRTDSIPQEQ